MYRVLMDLLWFSSLMVQNWLKKWNAQFDMYEITTYFVYFVNIEWKTSKPSIGNENLLYILKKRHTKSCYVKLPIHPKYYRHWLCSLAATIDFIAL